MAAKHEELGYTLRVRQPAIRQLSQRLCKGDEETSGEVHDGGANIIPGMKSCSDMRLLLFLQTWLVQAADAAVATTTATTTTTATATNSSTVPADARSYVVSLAVLGLETLGVWNVGVRVLGPLTPLNTEIQPSTHSG